MDQDNMNGSLNEEETDMKLGEKASNYIKDLIQEKNYLDASQTGNAMRLIDEEIKAVQSKGVYRKDRVLYLNVCKDKPFKISAKVIVPVKEYPKFNFLGKLLGPKGNSLKRLQEETMTKMSILGRGSMKDKEKEEELRKSLDPKFAHLSDDLHIEVAAFTSPAEAYARLSYAMAELKKYLAPDNWDEISTEQRREASMSMRGGGRGGSRGGGGRGGFGPMRRGGKNMHPSRHPHDPSITRPLLPTPSTNNKILSILDRARQSIDQSNMEQLPPQSYRDTAPPDQYYNSGPPPHQHQPDYNARQQPDYNARSQSDYNTRPQTDFNARPHTDYNIRSQSDYNSNPSQHQSEAYNSRMPQTHQYNDYFQEQQPGPVERWKGYRSISESSPSPRGGGGGGGRYGARTAPYTRPSVGRN